MEAPPLRWGILGTGWIASRFAAALREHTRQEVYAAGSRSLADAERFAAAAGASAAYGSYEGLVTDPRVEVVYVATPHNFHHAHARLALEAGKHVVVEKPMGLSAAECRDLGGLAAEQGLFLMEAMWTLFLPKFDVIRQLLEAGALGTVHSVIADMGEHFEADHRIMRADLAGGPMYDLGTYPVMLATWVLGEPRDGPSDGGRRRGCPAHLAARRVPDHGDHRRVGGDPDDRRAVLPAGWLHAESTDGRVLRYDEPRIGHAGLHWEAAEVARCISAGETESPQRPLADTVTTMLVLDAVREATSH